MDQGREEVRYYRYPYKTEQIHGGWIIRLIRFNAIWHLDTMGKPKIERKMTFHETGQVPALPVD